VPRRPDGTTRWKRWLTYRVRFVPVMSTLSCSQSCTNCTLALRITLLPQDSTKPGSVSASIWTPTFVPTCWQLIFGHALGCLYVLEGSSLGGRTVARIVRATLGEVPMTFLTGDGRSDPVPWLSLCNALARFEARGGDGGAVVSGACGIFAAFADHLNRRAPSQTHGAVTPI
jgi:heme oxygenase